MDHHQLGISTLQWCRTSRPRYGNKEIEGIVEAMPISKLPLVMAVRTDKDSARKLKIIAKIFNGTH